MMRKPILQSLLLFMLSGSFLTLISCSQDACLENTTPLLKATFYKTGSDVIRVPDSITVYGIGKENSKIYNKATGVSLIELPLDGSSESCGFVMKINTVTDTVRFTYSNYPHIISRACGIVFFHNLSSYKVSGSEVDTIIFRNSNITTSDEENIRIFF
jgi:hypothetical protein